MKHFEIAFQTKPHYQLGEKVVITFYLKNIASQPYTILTRDTPLDRYGLGVLNVMLDEKKLDYDGIVVKRASPDAGDFLKLNPNETVTAQMEITSAYAIHKSGHCTVDTTFDLIYFDKELEQTANFSTDWCEPNCTTNVFFQIVEGDTATTAIRTLGQLARQLEENERRCDLQVNDMQQNSVLSPIILNATDQEKNEIRQAHFLVYEYLPQVLNNLALKNRNLHYKMAFGAFENARFESVVNVFNSIHQVLQKEQITYVIDRSHIDFNRIFGYTHFGTRTIYICGCWIKAALSGTDSKMGTFLHELTHAVCSVNKKHPTEQYGRKACRELAKNQPDYAVDNADSYEFFTESQLMFWEQYQKIPFPFSAIPPSSNPSLCVFENTLYGFYKSKDSNKLYKLTYEKCNWMLNLLVDGVSTDAMPSSIVYKDKMYVAYKKNASSKIQYIVSKGSNFEAAQTIPVAETKQGPKLTVYQDKLSLFYTDDGGALHYITFDGAEWGVSQPVDTVKSSSSFAPAVFNGELYVIFVNTANHLCCTQYKTQPTIRWITSEIEISKNHINAESLVATVINNILHVTFRQSADNEIHQLQLIHIPSLNSEFWVGNETVYKNSEQNSSKWPVSLFPVSLVEYEKYRYAVFQHADELCFWVMQQR